MPVSLSASRLASEASETSVATASRRSSIAARSTSGAESHSPSSRAPIGDRVRSSTPASEPSRRPVARERTSSRLRREASSISSRRPGRQAASVSIRAIAAGSFCSKYATIPPAAAMPGASAGNSKPSPSSRRPASARPTAASADAASNHQSGRVVNSLMPEGNTRSATAPRCFSPQRHSDGSSLSR